VEKEMTWEPLETWLEAKFPLESDTENKAKMRYITTAVLAGRNAEIVVDDESAGVVRSKSIFNRGRFKLKFEMQVALDSSLTCS
jgi:hypothetical protein